ncbi:MAG: family 78 glycoside hydrolase catalytic domain [Verrucomicrobia bacterium]|nr:family 78 glycoside hydrolase catalytic domain [Verrucomicrobiota bacterium]
MNRAWTQSAWAVPGMCAGLSLAAAVFAGETRVTDLRCEYRVHPLGIDTVAPELSWRMESGQRGEVQTAYRVLVARDRRTLAANVGDLWDSGQVDSDPSIQIRYRGQALRSGQECFWKVRAWDRDGNPSAWSPVGYWSMGLLEPVDWEANGPACWIGLDEPANRSPADRRLPARYLRRQFNVERKVRRATAYVCGLGLFEFYLNGRKVGDHVLEPALSEYTKRAYYVTFDVASHLRRGVNVLGVILGNGRYFAPRTAEPTATRTFGYPKLLLKLRVEYADGSTADVVSDDTWKLTTNGPIRANNEYDGEEYDARMEFRGWSEPGYDDSAWQPARLVGSPDGPIAHARVGGSIAQLGRLFGPGSKCQMSAQMIDPIRVTETLMPRSVRERSPGVYLFDLGQNMVGWCRLTVRGPRGTRVTLRHAETLNPDGSLYVANLRSAKATDTYILKGGGTEVYEPRFTYHGFRYVELRGYPGKPDRSALVGRVVHDDLESAGAWTSSNPLLNQVYENVRWGVRGNYRSIPTDCPQRDERQGWLGDRSEESLGETYLFNTEALYRKWLLDMADAQKDNGSVPDVSPPYWPFYSDNVTWPSSSVIIPDHLYQQYADTDILARHYPCMQRWMEHLNGFVKADLMPRDTYGDWCVPPADPKIIHSQDPAQKTAPAILGTAYYYHCLELMARYATVLGRTDAARQYRESAARLKTAFNQKFLAADGRRYDNGSQTSCVLPLAFGLVPGADRGRIVAHLVEKIAQESHHHVGTGLVGGQWLMRTLSDNGRVDLAYALASQTTYPSWGYMISKGATTIWELWNGDTADPAMNSGNHVMLVGDLLTWMYEDLAGIRADPNEPGFKHILMRPEPVGNLRFLRATHRSPFGLIVSDWRRRDDVFDWTVQIPPNTTATVWVPGRDARAITESGQPAERAPGVRLFRVEGDRVVLLVGSGRYHFLSRESQGSR